MSKKLVFDEKLRETVVKQAGQNSAQNKELSRLLILLLKLDNTAGPLQFEQVLVPAGM